MIVKSERNSISQYSDRHSEMTNTLSPQEILNKKALTLTESCMKESSLIEMVSKVSLVYAFLVICCDSSAINWSIVSDHC